MVSVFFESVFTIPRANCIIFYKYTGFSDGCHSGMNQLAGLLNFLLEMSVSIFCLKISVKRLIKLYLSSKTMTNTKRDQRMEKHLSKLMHVSTKLTVLTLAAIISTMVNVIFFAPNGLLSGTFLDTAFNTICLLLSFVVFDKEYKFLCKGCDLCMFSCCTRHTKCIKGCCCVTV